MKRILFALLALTLTAPAQADPCGGCFMYSSSTTTTPIGTPRLTP